MRRWLAPVALCLALAACAGPDEAASRAVIDRFHVALNAGDWVAIDGLLSPSTRNLRPGVGTARAFRAIIQRHGRYTGGELEGLNHDDGRTTIAWSARYERGPVSELFVLVEAGGLLKIDSYTDAARP
ncbi:hypothetical protein [Sandarakinorhabdus sp.]|uniref:hypothetical protein n=1 Tax=Sandarakinorhabdus sp. TaxID=1916663 RepID=UPI00286E7FAD|nr:hypothetical protein [Sandarakinorhabdus sp.]